MNEKIIEKWNNIKALIEEASVDLEKTAKGNKSAGVRYRKKHKELLLELKDLKKLTLEISKD